MECLSLAEMGDEEEQRGGERKQASGLRGSN